MPTLANFDGRSLVPDIRTALDNITQIGERSRQETATQEAEDLAITAAGGTPPTRKGPLSFLNKVAPELFKSVQEITAGRADPSPDTVKAIDDTRTRARDNISVANRILREPDAVKKQRIVREDAERIRAAGGDITNHVRMSNLSPDELDLQAQKIKLSAEAARRAVPAPTASEREIARIKLAVRSPAAAEALRRQELQNQRLAQAERDRQAAARAPQTELGQTLAAIERDLQNGVITADTAATLTRNARATATGAAEAAAPQTELGQQLAAIERDLQNGVIDPETAATLTQNARTAATAAGGPTFAPVLNAAGQVIAQRNTETGELKSAPEAIVELSQPTSETEDLGLTPAQTGIYNAARAGGATPAEAQRYATAPAPTRARFDQFTIARKAIDPLLDEWVKFIDKSGPQILPGSEESQEAQTRRRAIQLQLKEILNLGVLNGPDLLLMDQMLASTQLGFGNLTPLRPGLTADRTRTSVKAIKEMLSSSEQGQRAVVFGPTGGPAARSAEIAATSPAGAPAGMTAGVAAAPAALPEVASKAEFDALPSGAEFMSGGRRFRKP